jgi:hypothetical protein
MRNIIRIKFGSHLYGTATPTSDLDFKSIHIPSARDILLGRAARSISTKRAKAEGEKNYAGEVDEESYSLAHFLKLVSEGQTVAFDVLFAPDWAALEPPAPEWQEIAANRHRLVTRKSQAFVGYCRQQANKYGIKGSRVAAARHALGVLNVALVDLGTTAKLSEISDSVDWSAARIEYNAITDRTLQDGKVIRHWEVCGRLLPYTSSIKSAQAIVQKLVDEYGHRALQAESQNGVDWKALSHAVRVGCQAIELLSTGEVKFPSANAEHLLAIKTGQLPYQEVAEEIEQILDDVEVAAARSSLRAEPDYGWIGDFVADVYRREIVFEYEDENCRLAEKCL